MAYEIPLTAAPQRFNIALQGVIYIIDLRWNHMSSQWYIDIYDGDSSLLVGNTPLVTGVNLLEQYDFLGFGGELRMQTDGNTDQLPTYDNLGTDSHLYFVVTNG